MTDEMHLYRENLTQLANVSSSQFRDVLRRFTSSVCIVTVGREHNFNGMTATAVCSVSASPPSMLVAVNQDNRSHALIEQIGAFAINLLSSGQKSLATHFASRPADPFAAVDYRLGALQLPIIRGCAAYLECVVDARLISGTHSIFIGRVIGSGASERHPLCYRNGDFVVSEE